MENPDLILPSVAVEGDELVIRITLESLCHSVTMADNWPTTTTTARATCD